MKKSVNVSLAVIAWVVLGIVVAVDHHYGKQLDNWSELLTFVVAVILWPVLVNGGSVRVTF